MAKCVIFCAAGFSGLAEPLMEQDHILAADGGLQHVQELGIQPDGILGDFDSLGYVPQNARVYPVEKDDTDSMLAVRHGLALGFREFMIYGGLDGARLDHALANYQTLQFLADRGAVGYLVGEEYIVTALRDGFLTFSEDAAGILSVFCLGPDARGVTLEGVQYPLRNSELTSGFPLGVSNHFIGQAARISVNEGSLLVMWDRKNGLPADRGGNSGE